MLPLTIEIKFPDSKSVHKSFAIDTAQQAKEYRQIGEGKAKYHIAKFDQNRDQLSLCLELLQMTRYWKGVSIKVNGVRVELWQLDQTITCYLQSCLAIDPKAYCWNVYTNHEGPVGFSKRGTNSVRP